MPNRFQKCQVTTVRR